MLVEKPVKKKAEKHKVEAEPVVEKPPEPAPSIISRILHRKRKK